jgi:hypothetical protein
LAKLAAEPRNKEWHLVTDPMQIPLKGEKTWVLMEGSATTSEGTGRDQKD